MSKMFKVLLSLVIGISAGNAMNDNSYQTNNKTLCNLYPQDLSNGTFINMNNPELRMNNINLNNNKQQDLNNSTSLDVFNNTLINNNFTLMNNINQLNTNSLLSQNFPSYPNYSLIQENQTGMYYPSYLSYPFVLGNQTDLLSLNNFTNSAFLQRKRALNTFNNIEWIKMIDSANNYSNIPNNNKILQNNLSNNGNYNNNNINNFISKDNDINANTIKLNCIQQEKDNNIKNLLNQNNEINSPNNHKIIKNINKIPQDNDKNEPFNYSNLLEENPKLSIINTSEQYNKLNNNYITNILREDTTIENVIKKINNLLTIKNIPNIEENILKKYIVLVCEKLQQAQTTSVSNKHNLIKRLTNEFFKSRNINIDNAILKNIRLTVYKSTRLYQNDRNRINDKRKKYYKANYIDGNNLKKIYQDSSRKNCKKYYKKNTNQRRDKQLLQQKSRDDFINVRLKLMQIWCKEKNLKYDRSVQRKQLQKTTRDESIKISENALSNEQLQEFNDFSKPYLEIFNKYKDSLFTKTDNKILIEDKTKLIDGELYQKLKESYPEIDEITLKTFIENWLSRKSRNRVSKYDTDKIFKIQKKKKPNFSKINNK